jgi:4-hydroxybenzoate polyprenyltransferase/phosphoserine phosphatase
MAIAAKSTLPETYTKPWQTPLSQPSGTSVPLVVDLDGTLVKTDLLIESVAALLKDEPRYVFALPLWLLKGRAGFKQEIARRISLEAGFLPYRSEFVEYLQTQRAQGRSMVLATAGDERLAQQVADHLNLFDSVLASDGSTNLSGERKRERLVSHFGERGFDYAANESRDIAVWSAARKAIVVNPNQRLARAVARVAEVQSVFKDRRAGLVEYFNALRPRDWLKNLLVFVPLLTAHRFFEPMLLGKALIAFMAFCLCASSGYLFNDLVNLSADRHHPQKRLRPFAAGRLPLSYALAMIPALIVLGCVLGLLVSRPLVGILLLYSALTLTYSLYIKKVALLDVISLAGLYTLRVMAGGASVVIWPSEWLLAFSMFLFLSLALVKRYGELVVMRSVEGDHAKARSYEISDAELLASKGTASGYIAVLVLALYITSGAAKALYGKHELIWFLCPLLLYWIGHIWLVAHRGEMHDDPLLFAMHDRTSRILLILMLGTALLAI